MKLNNTKTKLGAKNSIKFYPNDTRNMHLQIENQKIRQNLPSQYTDTSNCML